MELIMKVFREGTWPENLFYLYDGLSGDVSDDFEQVGGLSTLNVEGVDNELGALVQVTGGDL